MAASLHFARFEALGGRCSEIDAAWYSVVRVVKIRVWQHDFGKNIPAYLLQRLQSVLNAAARTIAGLHIKFKV